MPHPVWEREREEKPSQEYLKEIPEYAADEFRKTSSQLPPIDFDLRNKSTNESLWLDQMVSLSMIKGNS